jgi:diguanylate cyclase (GGDEF)-like protein/PAS domain S-box-containing protein
VSVGVVADLTFNLVQLEVGSRSASWADAVFLVCYVMLIGSGELYWRRPVAGREISEVPFKRFQAISPLPYLAVGTTYVLLLVVALRPWTDPISGLAVGALLVTGLVVLRQLLTVRENVRLLAEHAARQNEARFRSLVQHSSDVIIVTRADGTVRFVSPSATRVFGYDPAAMLRQTVPALLHPDDRERATTFLRHAAQAPGVTGPIEWRFRQPDGSWLHAEILATNLLRDATVRGVVLNTRDVSDRRRLEEQLTHQAFHDPLTGLANRALFRDRVSHALALAQRRGTPVTVLFLDLDDFKTVNDSLGHAEGDRLLIAAAERFLACARSADTVARLGGDEFAILIEGADGREGLPERLGSAMEHPFSLSGNQLRVTASIGVATASTDDTADDLLRNADVAMYRAKDMGRNAYQFYAAEMTAAAHERLNLESAMRRGYERGEFVLYYQPILDLASGAVVGAEALMRWRHPERGMINPAQFIPLAEETGLIIPLGEWALRTACAECREWERLGLGPLRLAVNISPRQFQRAGLAETVATALRDTGMPAERLELELTEGVLLNNPEGTIANMERLSAMGVQLCIDDFGTGYSSLSYLKRFPIDQLKIDRSFVSGIPGDEDDAAIATAIIAMAHNLKLRVIAEGVETIAQLEYLRTHDCDGMQGDYFSPAVPRLEFIERVRAQPRLALPARKAAAKSRRPRSK